MHREPEHLTEDDLRGMLKSDLLEAALELRHALHLTLARHDRAQRHADAVAEERHVAQLELAAAEARIRALEECNDHERRRLDTLTGAVNVSGLDGYDLDEVLDALTKLTKGARR